MAWKKPKAIDINGYKTKATSINDLSKNYGMDYSRGYAQQQAQAVADAKRTGLNNQMRQVDDGVKTSNDALSRDYFQKYLQQAQGQAGAGLNSGIQADQNLRLNMNRQASLADVYRNAATQKAGLSSQLAAVGNEQAANENQIYNDRLQQAYQNAMSDTSRRQSENQSLLNAEQQQRGQDINSDQWAQSFDKSNEQWDKNFKNQNSQWQKSFDTQNSQWQKSFDQQAKEYKDNKAWREYTFNNMSASDKAQFEWTKKTYGEDAAWRMYELEYNGELQKSQNNAQLEYYKSLGLTE
ncbi:MAG: hypothetical protein ABF649_00800 [Bacillus sp. (in: firmicutes)]